MPSTVTFRWNVIARDRLLKEPGGDVHTWLVRKGVQIERLAKAQVGVKSGNLKRSISTSIERKAYGQQMKIGSNLRYAASHHEGSRPHMIQGRRGGNLRFTKNGRVIHTRRVMHPGTRANKYLSSNLFVVLLPQIAHQRCQTTQTKEE